MWGSRFLGFRGFESLGFSILSAGAILYGVQLFRVFEKSQCLAAVPSLQVVQS